mmetsp:Transcript_38190/g.76527  ORF Transcript_38190/g.76527 Transcript_38190/m.76527 type:complete len:83 (+) Transcript_38190:315-563(+)
MAHALQESRTRCKCEVGAQPTDKAPVPPLHLRICMQALKYSQHFPSPSIPRAAYRMTHIFFCAFFLLLEGSGAVFRISRTSS